MEDVLNQPIGLTFGLVNFKNSEMNRMTSKKKSDEVIIGNAEMLAML